MRFGIDLGGTKTEILALDEGGRASCLRRRIATPRRIMTHCCAPSPNWWPGRKRNWARSGSVGVAIPGSDQLRHRPDQERQLHLAERQAAEAAIWKRRWGARSRLANDANCFALSEATDGAAQGARPCSA